MRPRRPELGGAHDRVSAETIQQIWIVTLVVYGVVLVVVAVLLTLILRAAREVRTGVSAIWTVGSRSPTTPSISRCSTRTNHIAAEILDVRRGRRGRDRRHGGRTPRDCPGCPACVLGPEPTR